MKREPRPCTAEESCARAELLIGIEAAAATPHPYILSAGRYNPARPEALPFSPGVSEDAVRRQGTKLGCDCSAFIKWCAQLPSLRPNFNKGAWATVTGSINVDSLIEDGQHEHDLVQVVTSGPPLPGDLLAWPSVRGREIGKTGSASSRRFRVGHISLVLRVRAAEWDWTRPSFELLDVGQCGSRHTPAVHRSTGAAWNGQHRFQGRTRASWASVVLRFVR